MTELTPCGILKSALSSDGGLMVPKLLELLKKLQKSIETERRGMLARGDLTPAGQFYSSQRVYSLDRSLALRL